MKGSTATLPLVVAFIVNFSMTISVGAERAEKTERAKKKEAGMLDTALFLVDEDAGKIIGPSQKVGDHLKLQFFSVTTDQPVYWPDEEVFLKVMLPAVPSAELAVTLLKKDAAPVDIGTVTLGEGGLLVKKIMSGRDGRKMEVGEYRVVVTSKDGGFEADATFSVVEGALGAVSFAHPFEEVTNPNELREVKGGWYLGNASGVGERWGNGLNVKNEIRVMNLPFSGEVTIHSRCYLPGCNGVIAGPALKTKVKNGLLEAVLDVSGHSGPFEIEVITEAGSLRHLFAKSGHVERQTVKVAHGMTGRFEATLAPYEDTTPVPGRGIYILRRAEKKGDAYDLKSPICDEKNETKIVALKEVAGARMYLYIPGKGKDFERKEVEIAPLLKAGAEITVPCSPPYSLVAIGGFEPKAKRFYEGWAILFPPSLIEVNLAVPQEGEPLRPVEIEIKTTCSRTGEPLSISGILEVFDNRVPSKSPMEPLVSSVGDSFRRASQYLATKPDWVRQGEEVDAVGMYEMALPSSKVAKVARASKARSTPLQTMYEAPIYEAPLAPEEGITEEIREGEKKVVFCDVVKTDHSGKARVSVDLPPQIGRCNVRFVAASGYDYAHKIQGLDVRKNNYIEVGIQPLLLPGATVTTKVLAVNSDKQPMTLRASGAGLTGDLVLPVPSGRHEIDLKLEGTSYGKLDLHLVDAQGKVRDRKQVEIRSPQEYQVTFSRVVVSDGTTIVVPEGEKAAIFAGPAMLLEEIVQNVVTTIYSWFSHSEALSAAAAIRAMLLLAMEEKVIGEEGMRDTLKTDLAVGVSDLRRNFYNPASGLVRPFPGIEENPLWSLWVLRNLTTATDAIKGNAKLKKELADTLKQMQEMKKGIAAALKAKGVDAKKEAFFDPEAGGVDVLPIVIDGKTVYRAVTDDAVADWYVKNIMAKLDLPEHGSAEQISLKMVKMCDTYMFLKAFERTGNIYYLLLNAKALLLKDRKEFYQLFATIARDMAATRDPGMIQGPALLGGVYSAPQTLVKYLDLLVFLARKKAASASPKIEIKSGKGKEKLTLGKEPLLREAKDGDLTINAPPLVTVRMDREATVNLYEYLSKKPFFKVAIDSTQMKVGEETVINVRLDENRNPVDYYAIVVAPSNTSIRQTWDLLSDYKGKLLYGQKASGGVKIQLLTAPLRGSRAMNIALEATLKGESEGYVLLRHMSNPEIIAAVKLPAVTVK